MYDSYDFHLVHSTSAPRIEKTSTRPVAGGNALVTWHLAPPSSFGFPRPHKIQHQGRTGPQIRYDVSIIVFGVSLSMHEPRLIRCICSATGG